MIRLVITVIVGLIGGLTAMRFKIPAGAMVGSMVLVALFNIITGSAYMPQDVRIVTQMAAGAFVGSGIRYKDVQDLRLMVKPAVLMVVSMIILDMIMGYIMYKLTNIDLATALFASAPGGIVDMSLISSDMGADSSKVAILQLIRIISVMMTFPVIMKFVSDHFPDSKKVNENSVEEESGDTLAAAAKLDNKKNKKKENSINLALTIVVAAIAGFIGYKLKIPAGAMTFAMIAAGALNVIFSRGYMPLNLRRLTQVFAGILIGERMTYADVISLKSAALPAIVLLIGIILVNLCIGFLISRISRIELLTSLLASAPGGVSDMALIAKDLGGDGPKVAILQLARYVCVIAFFPIVIKFLCSI